VSNAIKTDDHSALSKDEFEALLKVIVCDVDEKGMIACKSPDGLSYHFNYLGQLIRGPEPKKTIEVLRKLPTLTITNVNNKGRLTLRFSEDMILDTLVNTTWEGRN